MQLDRIPPTKRHPTDDEVWNWRINRATGQDVLRQKLDLAVKYGRNIREGTVYRDQPAPYDWYKEPITHKIVEYENATDLTTEEQLWKETFHSYRGGVYWRWRPINPSDPESPGEWIAQPTQNHERGDEAWTIYQDVLNGNPPPGWNQ